MLSKLLSEFPAGYTPSDQQSQLLKEIESAFDSGYKFVICNAPTGSGKSFISKTLSNASKPHDENYVELINSYEAYKRDQSGQYINSVECDDSHGGAFALTITKSLQDQYKQLFNDTEVLKGKANYQCDIDPNFDVETAPCIHSKNILNDCWQKNRCPYYKTRNKSLTSKFSALNYKMFLALPKHVKNRDYIICDEASELEDEIVRQFSILIDIKKLRLNNIKVEPLTSTKSQIVFKWINTININIVGAIEELLDVIKQTKTPLASDINRHRFLKTFQLTLTQVIENWNTCEYIIQLDDKEHVRLTPLKIDSLTKYIFQYADKILLMSATIIDHANLAKVLGIKKYKYVEAQSVFDPKKAPIYISQTNRLNQSNLQKALPTIIKQIKQICAEHKDEKGVIHTHTNYITSYIQERINESRFLYRDNQTRNEDILELHLNSNEPTVLVSPSLGLGVDLKDDLARFQIIVKAAFLPLGDDRIKKLFSQDKQWYENKMLSNFIQQCGRGIRSSKDHCVTYVLDATIFNAIVRNKEKLPRYFLDRFV